MKQERMQIAESEHHKKSHEVCLGEYREVYTLIF
jgi:hypothetical protein